MESGARVEFLKRMGPGVLWVFFFSKPLEYMSLGDSEGVELFGLFSVSQETWVIFPMARGK